MESQTKLFTVDQAYPAKKIRWLVASLSVIVDEQRIDVLHNPLQRLFAVTDIPERDGAVDIHDKQVWNSVHAEIDALEHTVNDDKNCGIAINVESH